MKIIIYLSVVVLLLTTSGCSKEDDINQLPPATQTGENIFGCKINGVVYKCSGYFNPARDIIGWSGVSGNYGDGRVVVNALISENEIHERRSIGIYFNCIENRTGIYRDGIKYQLQSPMDGYDSKVEITRFDKEVISGIFQMKIHYIGKKYDPDGINFTTYEEIVTITEGRFDIKRNN